MILWQLAHSKQRSATTLHMDAMQMTACGALGEHFVRVGRATQSVEPLKRYLMLAQESSSLDDERNACHALGTAHEQLGK